MYCKNCKKIMNGYMVHETEIGKFCPVCDEELQHPEAGKIYEYEYEKTNINDNLKYDDGKTQMGLVFTGLSKPLLEIGKVLTYGAKKYKAHSWQNLKDAEERYTDALYRHLNAFHQGENTDQESGLLHLAHAATNLLFLLYFRITK